MSKVEAKEFDPKDLGGFVWSVSGHRAADLGDDGNVMILGHLDDVTALAAYAEHQRYNSGDDLSAEDLKFYDVSREQVVFVDHDEGCEAVCCACEEQVCDACREGGHDACDGCCECLDGFGHELPSSGICACECYCDDYAWWAINVKPGHGHPVTVIRYSWKKAREMRSAA